MANLLKMELSDIVALLKGSGNEGGKSPHAKTIFIGFLLVVILVAYLMFIYLPGQNRLNEQRFKIAQIDGLRQEIMILQQDKLLEMDNLKASENRYLELSRLFHTEQEFEDLYSQLTTIAFTKGLTITKIEKGEELTILESKVNQDETSEGDEFSIDEPMYDEMGNEIESQPAVAFYKIPMNIEITGPYLRYLEFRKSLSRIPKLVNIDKEAIVLIPDTKGQVKISSVLSTFRMPAKDAKETGLRSSKQ